MAEIPVAEVDVDAAFETIDTDGFVVLESVIESDLITELVTTIDRLMDELSIQRGDNDFLGHHTRRIFNLLARDALFAKVPVHPRVLPVIERVLDHQCLLSSLTAIEMGPGQRAQPLHADDGSIALPRPHVPIVCPAIWALTDFTLDNGATHVVPGSQRSDRRPGQGERAETHRAVMPKGSVIIYNGSVWHGGGDNDSHDRRMGIVVNYCAGYIRQEENQLLGVPREMVATFDRRLQQMLGWGVYRGLMGHTDQRDPGQLLDPDIETDLVWKKMR